MGAVNDLVSRLDRKGKIICSLVIGLSVMSAILGFSAEGERVRPDEVRRVNNSCFYPKSSALGLGISSALFLLAAQIILNVFAGCVCCERRTTSEVARLRIATLILFLSWITFFFAFTMLLVGASLNQRHQDDHWYSGDCFVIKGGVFAGAAVLSLATGALGVIYYLAATEVRKQEWANRQPGVTMGQSYASHQFGTYSPYPQSSQFPSL